MHWLSWRDDRGRAAGVDLRGLAAVAELCGTRAGLSRAPLCSSVLDDRNGRPARRFRSIRRQRNQAVTKSALYRDSQFPRRVALPSCGLELDRCAITLLTLRQSDDDLTGGGRRANGRFRGRSQLARDG